MLQVQELSSARYLVIDISIMPLSLADLEELVSEIASELQGLTYEEWLERPSVDTFERVWRGEDVQVEVIRLETKRDYIQVGIAVDDGSSRFAWSPVGRSIVIPR